jgi:H+/gluconate symporter-like permease
MSGFSKFVYVGIFVAIIGAFLVYGFGKLDHKKEKASNKRRKSPKKE